MKIALYIEDGIEQIVLTPQSDTEKSLLGKLHDGSRRMEIHRGEFYNCQGGWVRHGFVGMDDAAARDISTIIVLKAREGQRED
jgi:hypothetical protein